MLRLNRFAVKYNALLANFFYASLPWAKPVSQQPLARRVRITNPPLQSRPLGREKRAPFQNASFC